MQRIRFYGGLFLVTAATLMLQIVQTRILSVVAWYYLAFFVISIAMFGLTAGAVWVYLQRDRFTEATLSHDLAYFSSAFAVTTALCFAIQLTLAPVSVLTVTTVVTWLEIAMSISLPFFFSGVLVSLALTRSPYPIGRVYGIDLAGAAFGCLGVLALLNHTDGPSAVLWVSVQAAAAALLFAGSGIGSAPASAPPLAWLLRRRWAVLLALVGAAVGNGLTGRGMHPVFVKERAEVGYNRPDFVEWNSFSRVAVKKRLARSPRMWGPSKHFDSKEWAIEELEVTIDGHAYTATYGIEGDPNNAAFLRYDITNLAYFLPDRNRAAVIGVGGGRDVLGARIFGVPEITGIEINPILVRLLTTEKPYADFAGINRLPGVQLVVDEARSWFARTEQRFDVIQMSLIDTWAATGAGAFSLSENGLYTVEAWRIFLKRLTSDGVFTVSRWHAPDISLETGRMVSVATAALLDLGASNPSDHLFLASAGRLGTLVLSRSPLSPGHLEALYRATAEMQYTVLLGPGVPPNSEVLANILGSRSRAELDQYTRSQLLDLTPATDDRPFFFNQLPLYSVRKTLTAFRARYSGGVQGGNVLATGTLLVLFLISAGLVLATIVIPLRSGTADVGRRLVIGGTAYFILTGVGFMSVEIGLLQRMSVFLGHPIYALSIVLFSIILATGIGSMISDWLPLDHPVKFAVWSVLTGGYLFTLPGWLPSVALGFDGATLAVRAGVCLLAIFPAGLLMGYGFPTGMRMISAVDRKPTPWFWGINGAASVLASSLAVACSIAFGISTTLLIGGVCYWLLMVAALVIGFHPERPTGKPQEQRHASCDFVARAAP